MSFDVNSGDIHRSLPIVLDEKYPNYGGAKIWLVFLVYKNTDLSHGKGVKHKQKGNIATGKMSPAITPYHFFGNFDFFNFNH